jgi:ribosomal 50S subunit-associated protein YjgA (DUF615 family)
LSTSKHPPLPILMQASGLGADWPTGTFSVLRRFRDFDWVRDQLSQRLTPRGVVVPPLPEKVLKVPFSDHLAESFTETRRLFLERFLQRCAEHPETRKASALREFLVLDDLAFTAAKESARGDTSEQLRRAGLAASALVSTGVKALRAAVDRARGVDSAAASSGTKSAEDLSFEGIQAFLERSRRGWGTATTATESLLTRRRARALAAAEMGVAAKAFGRVEREGLGAALEAAGQGWVQEARAERRVAEGHIDWAAEEMRDMERVVAALQEALTARRLAADRRVAALHALEHRRDLLNALRGVHGKEAEAAEAEKALHDAEHDVELETNSEQEVNRTVVAEFERIAALRLDETQRIVLELAVAEKARAQGAAAAWGDIVAALEEKVVEERGRAARWAAEDPASITFDSAKAAATLRA